MRSIPQLLMRVRRQITLDSLVVAVWTGVLVTIEIAGRKSPYDMIDGAVLLGLATLALLTLFVHSEHKLNCVRLVRRMLKVPLDRLRASLNIEYGIDLRRTPPMPRGGATLWRTMFWSLCAATILLAVGAAHCPSAIRAVLAPHFYLGYLFLLGALWGTVLLVGAVCGFVAWGGIHDWLCERYDGQGPRPIFGEFLASSALLFAIAAGAAWLPMLVPVVLIGSCFVLLTLASVLINPDLVLLWKHPTNERVYSVDGRWWMWMQAGFLVLVPLDLVLLCRGEALWGSSLDLPHSTMPATVLLGDGLAWLAVAGTLVLTGLYLRTVLLGISLNPRWAPRPTAHVAQVLTAEDRHLLRREFQQAGWNVRFAPSCRRRADVPVRFASKTEAADESETIAVSAEAFRDPEFVWRLNRRAELHYRRLVVRGLERLFKRASRRSRDKGHGVWIGLQHWFIMGMGRDDEDSAEDREATALDRVIGLPFHRLFPRACRLDHRKMMEALQVDLIFVEDGVSFRRFVRVLRVLFEVYDMHAGQQRVEERHFVGLPGTRVVVDEYDLGGSTTHELSGYPEPDYKELARARILHVFRDRGEEEATDFVPTGSEGAPIYA